MGGPISLLLLVLLAADPAASSAPPPSTESGDEPVPARSVAEESKAGVGVAPVELIPRLELRQSFVQLEGGLSVHVTTTQIDIQFLDRLLLRYEGTLQIVKGPTGQQSGFGDAQIDLIGLVAADPSFVAVLIAGVVLDTASQPALGAGKQQLLFGARAAMKPVRWWLPYLLVQEQFSVAGDSARSDVNQLVARLGNIAFGKGYTWYKVDLDTVIDFAADAGQLFGRLEVGRLLIGRVGLFMRAGTQLAGTRAVEYSSEVGIRYLFRLGSGR